jgi:hypothetical protein
MAISFAMQNISKASSKPVCVQMLPNHLQCALNKDLTRCKRCKRPHVSRGPKEWGNSFPLSCIKLRFLNPFVGIIAKLAPRLQGWFLQNHADCSVNAATISDKREAPDHYSQFDLHVLTTEVI